MKPTITIIGANLTIGRLHLHRKGFTVKIIEASDRVAELKPI
jgi:hypothetical protein